MNVSLAHIGVRLGLCLCWLSAAAPREANAQLSGLFQSVPGTLAVYQYQANDIQTVMLLSWLAVQVESEGLIL